jgi:hypothetical protein
MCVGSAGKAGNFLFEVRVLLLGGASLAGTFSFSFFAGFRAMIPFVYCRLHS